MATHSLAISHGLEAAGIEKKHAEAIATAVVTYSDDSFATKADIAGIKAEIADMKGEFKAGMARLEAKVNIAIALNIGLIIAFLADKFAG